MIDAPERATYSVPEAAAVMGISPRHLYELIARGEFPVLKLGARRLITKRAVAERLEAASR